MMNFYLSSYKLGNERVKLQQMIEASSGKIGFIPNALDFSSADPVRRESRILSDCQDIEELGAKTEILDLKKYFGCVEDLKKKMNSLGGVYVSGGNTFVLLQAMKLSGFDDILLELSISRDFLYVAYSAGACVLSPTLEAYSQTDDATDFPYPEMQQQIWKGLGILDFVFEPHYKSDHPESASIDKEVEYCIANKLLFKAYRDGEVLIIES